MSSGSGRAAPRYAPEDPTLPKPWKGLVDGTTGYLYYWNPDTNVTQYERPLPPEDQLPPPPPPLPPPPPRHPSDRHRRERDRSRERRRRRDSDDEDVDDDRSRHQGGSGRGGSADAAHGHGGGKASRDSRTALAPSKVHHGLAADEGVVEAYRRQHDISIIGDDVPAPITTFESSGFPSEILKEINHAGFSSPTPIQAQSWPIALQSQDIVAIAKTGSGKTLGYLLPGFMHIKRLRNSPKIGPTVLVLAPTRELATQILEEAVKFGRSSRISCTCLYGGAPKGPQLRDLERGVDVVVATPGRLNDILEMRRISLRQVSYLVLDEADRMLDMGFEPQIRKIVKDLPHRRQTLMFTATWPKEVRKIAEDLLVHPIQVNIGRVDELVANSSITQHVEVITPAEKHRRLEQILRSQDPGSKILVFCTTKRMCDQLSRTLTRQFGAAAIHGDKSQTEREKVLNSFRTGRSPILVATDVAARGLDIKDIRVVINYDFPTGIEDYVHRIGRTGRAGATGDAYTFFCDQDSKYAADLVKILEGADQHVPRELMDMSSRGGRGGRSRRWGTRSRGGRDRGRSRAGLDSSYGGKSGSAPSSGRLESSRSGRGGDDYDARGRYDYGESDGRARKSTGRGRSRSRSRSGSRRYSPSPKRARHHELQTNRSSRSRSLSRSPSRSPSRSRNHSWNHGSSRSRSRSRSASREFDQIAAVPGIVHTESRYSEQENSPTVHPASDPHYSQKEESHLDDGQNMGKVDLGRSPSPQDLKSTRYSHMNNGKHGGSNSPKWQEGSPHPRGGTEDVSGGDTSASALPVHKSKGRDEEEEGMIHADEDGEIIQDDARLKAAAQNDSGN